MTRVAEGFLAAGVARALAVALMLCLSAGCNRKAPAPAKMAAAVAGASGASVTPTAHSDEAPDGAAGPADAPVAQGGGAPSAARPRPAPKVVGKPSPLGDPPKAVPDSSLAIDRSTPAALLDSLSKALAAHDLAALARMSVEGAKRPGLDENDVRRAERDFVSSGREAFWRRVLEGARSARVQKLGSDDRVRLEVPVGGALGQVNVNLSRSEDGWSLEL